MTSLHITFPEGWYGWDMKELSLASAVESGSQSPQSDCDFDSETLTVRVDPKSNTDFYSDAPVFHGTMYNSRRPTQRNPVVLKFAMRDDVVSELIYETEMYLGPLERLQGSVVPKCHGFYSCVKEDGQTIACLVLENCGEVIKQPFAQLPMDTRGYRTTIPTRIRILEGVGSIHRQGLLHGDFAERNILQRKDGDIRLIDFGQSRWHQCECDMNFRPGPAPQREHFGCEYLWDACSHMRIWSGP